MPTLRARVSGEARSWELAETPLTIGRRPDNAVVLAEKFVSARHAVIRRDNGRFHVEDLGSSNGTRLNGRRVERAALKDGDIVQIGSFDLHFSDEPGETVPIDRLASSSAVAAEAPANAGQAQLLDELVNSIRSHREREHSEREQAVTRLREEWDKLLSLAEQLKAKVADDPRVKHFGIDRRANDIIIRIRRSPDQPPILITAALNHPDHRDHALNGIWLLRTGEPDRCLPTAQAVGTELIRELAFLLA